MLIMRCQLCCGRSQLQFRGGLPSLALLSASQRRRIPSAATSAMIRRCSETAVYPPSWLEAYLTMLRWSAWIPKGSASAWPGTTADARGTTCLC